MADTFRTERSNFDDAGADVTTGQSKPPTGRWQLVAETVPGLPAAASFSVLHQ
ncbi:MAG TPA: hypothetical protein VFQ74_04260 [Pseudolysinimonas sp.]|nr:hypothetical protein [Pseudolysinimonas sp.]